MKNKIKTKFSGIKHKWIYFHVDTQTFQRVIDVISSKVHSKEIKSKDAIKLVKCFKKQEKVFLKFIKTVGRKNFNCLCHIIDENNNKLDIILSPEILLSANLLGNSPKAMNLYQLEKSKKGWKKPDDGFIDPINYPPVEEELTELGYAMYKDWTEEVAASGMNSQDYYRKLCGILKYYKRK